MKAIKDMNLREVADEIELIAYGHPLESLMPYMSRIYELHKEHEALKEQTRWIPITERMPTDEDTYNGMVLIKSFSGDISTAFITHLGTYTHDHVEKWQRINYPN